MALARLRAALNRQEFEAARERAQEALTQTQGDPWREPEAIYWSAVAGYKATHDPKPLIEGWNRLLDKFPESEWARRAGFIRD
jgi:hypothetical protein